MIPQTPHIAKFAKKENDGMGLCLRKRTRHSILACLSLVTVFSMFLLTTVNVQANTVTIDDQAGVLDAGRVQAEAAKVSVPMLIYTTKTFNGDQDALNTSTRERLPNQDAIAIGIDTVHRNLSIEAGTNVQLSDSQASDAVSAFQSNIDNGGDYTSATIAALDSVQNALSGGGPNPFLLAVVIAIAVSPAVYAGVGKVRRWRRTGGSSRGSYFPSGGGSSGGGGAGGHSHGDAVDDEELSQGNWLVSQIKNSKVAASFSETILCRIGMHQGTWITEGRSGCLQRRFCMYCGIPQQRERHNWPPEADGEYSWDRSCATWVTCFRCGKTKFSGIRHAGRISWSDNYCKRCGQDLGGGGGGGGDGGGGGHGGGAGGHF